MTRKKLIEVALPLEAINIASAREKSIRHGHPSTLHLWWARRPLAAVRAVLFASLVDDPDHPEAPSEFVEMCQKLPKGPNTIANDTPRMRLFDFIELLVKWESTTNEDVLNTARQLIQLSTNNNPPAILDPFAGGGSIPLEAQRLGLKAYASDLNPVAVMINKAQIEIPPRFADMPPVNPHDNARVAPKEGWSGASGLAADVRYYGAWMREKAWERIGHLYPQHNGETIIAWIWARTVKSPNPAIDAHVPLVRSFELSKKKGKRAWIDPIVEGDTIRYVVRHEATGDDTSTIPTDGTTNRKGATCFITNTPIPFEYIRAEGKAGRMGAHLMAIVTEGEKGRNYYSPDDWQVKIAESEQPSWKPQGDIPQQALGFRIQLYGMDEYHKLFTPRQLVALTTFSDLIAEARTQTHADALLAGLADDDIPLRDGGRGALAYSEAVSVYLAFAVDKGADYWSTICSWHTNREGIGHTFTKQSLPMVWDYVEANPLSDSSGNFLASSVWVANALERTPAIAGGEAVQQDAMELHLDNTITISTDPPYYDNIGYADLSDFFYVWMRHSLRGVYPDLFRTLLVPKDAELVATPFRFGGDKVRANHFFEDGMVQTFTNMRRFTHSEYPLTVYYAFKEQETDANDPEWDDDGSNEKIRPDKKQVSTGWETMLNGIVQAGFAIDGTYPMRTELSNRMVGMGTNALASSIVLVCRPRPEDAPVCSRREFLSLLRAELPEALYQLQTGNIAPVDLAQASIGPGMAVYSRYAQVREADGTVMSIRTALGLINQALDEYLAEQDGILDPETRFAVAWFEQYEFKESESGKAIDLARAKMTTFEGLEKSGLIISEKGKVRLIAWEEYDAGAWSPKLDKRPTIWEATHHLIERLKTKGEQGSASLLAEMPADMASEARQLAYRLYNICERKKWANLAQDYNALVVSWLGITEAMSAEMSKNAGEQLGFDF